jgi:hypothetical protein
MQSINIKTVSFYFLFSTLLKVSRSGNKIVEPYHYPECISLIFWMKLWLNNFVSRLTDLYTRLKYIVYGPFGCSNMHSKLISSKDQTSWEENKCMYHFLKKLLFQHIYCELMRLETFVTAVSKLENKY